MCGQCCITRRGRAAETHRVRQPHAHALSHSFSLSFSRREMSPHWNQDESQMAEQGWLCKGRLCVSRRSHVSIYAFLDPRRSRRHAAPDFACPIQDGTLLEIKGFGYYAVSWHRAMRILGKDSNARRWRYRNYRKRLLTCVANLWSLSWLRNYRRSDITE